MNQVVYQNVPFKGRSFFQRLFGQHPEENAVIELNNLLAARPIKEIRVNDIAQIEEQYKISLEKEFSLNLQEFYAVYLNQCLQDKILSDEELDELKHLKKILALDDKIIANIHSKIGGLVYKQSFEKAVSDGRLTKTEEAFLDKLETDLCLPKALTDKISSETRQTFISNYLHTVIQDQRFSPNEEKEIRAISNSLNIELKIDGKTKQILEKLKLYWALDNLELPVVEVDIVLQKNEKCHIRIENVKWYEIRSVRQKTVSKGPSNFRGAKEFYLNSSSYKSRSYNTGQMKLINTGNVYLTNKRIIFTGNEKNSNIRLEKILNIIPYSDGVEIGKETGKSPILHLLGRSDVFCMILERLLREHSEM